MARNNIKAEHEKWKQTHTEQERYAAQLRGSQRSCDARRKYKKFISMRNSMIDLANAVSKDMLSGEIITPIDVLERAGMEVTFGNLLVAQNLLSAIRSGDQDRFECWIRETCGKVPDIIKMESKSKIDFRSLSDDELNQMIDAGETEENTE